MVWPFGKKQKKEIQEIPELPELPELPPLKSLEFQSFSSKPEFKEELSPLPSFPRTETGEKISQEAVKQAIKEPVIKPYYTTPSKIPLPKTQIPKVEIIPSKQIRRTREIKGTYRIKPEIVRETRQVREIARKEEPIFVRIDKYQEAQSCLQEIKRELLEIENLLRDIREVRQREEAELELWEQEIQEAKAKLNNIDKSIFSKLEEEA